MTKIARNFVAGKMNKVVDQRLIPEGEYIDAMNIRMGDTEKSEIGVIENSKGNTLLTTLQFNGIPLSTNAKCIGAIEDSANETIYWFVHDSLFDIAGDTYKMDMIVSYNISNQILTYHVVSINILTDITVLNFDYTHTITGVNIIEDLLFFTDDYNPPRFINIKRSYNLPIGYIDTITSEELLVIKRPPIESPTVKLIKTAGQSNYLDTRFICFAYRYRYADGEYSATSQWSAPAFSPNQFNFSIESLLNEGMVNAFNAAEITYNSGGPLVVGIDLLFKQSNNSIIKVIEKIDKQDAGLGDGQDYQYVFSDSKIFTVLPESEILRLYDNVPRFAKAQTIMGNRLMYGNYIEGYDLVDELGLPIQFTYYTTLISEVIGVKSIPDTLGNGNYSVFFIPYTANNSIVYANLTGIPLIEGSSITISITFTHFSFYGVGVTEVPTQQASNLKASFTFVLPRDYTSVYQMAISTEFSNAIGNYLNVQPMSTACDGITFSDQINCLVPNTLSNGTTTWTKQIGTISGTSFTNQGLGIIASTSSDSIGIQLTATTYTATGHNTFAEYYQITYADIVYQKVSSPRSLHSNRGYEVGIVYMDDYNRATTALVSKNNTEHISCGLSSYQNSVRVTIPPSQRPPYWATRYKFVIKPDQENYETIYSNIFFVEKVTNQAYFLLEGENAKKVENGDRFIVKADSDGPTESCVYATVLEKESKTSGFIETITGAVPPVGVYMKMNPNSFSVVEDKDSIISYGRLGEYTDDNYTCPVFSYPMSYPNPDGGGMYTDYNVPAGSRIVMSIFFDRGGRGCPCEKRRYTLDKTLTASANYNNMEDWFIGDNVQSILNDGEWQGSCGATAPNNVFETGHGNPSCALGTNYYRFDRDANNRLYFKGSGTWACGGWGSSGRRSYAYATFTVYRADNLFIFETEPTDALPDVFFENELSFTIESGNHFGNVQNQDIGANISAVIDTGFFNCFAFGNGAESYKIRDSIIGRPFNLGQRVTSVSAQDYKEADRFSDITYSGIYNPESNVNKLNEFNLGLLNYKHLEASFGDIYIMDGRETDVLVLQEDKISYVLAGKNLLSDAAAGGAITSVPEVLGTQIARTEKYGISFNPESYVQWGYNRYFTDSKRGVVLQLKGDSYSNEQLSVISEVGMRTWFRDEFNNSFNTQKLGGFDPYLNEYVLSSNNTEIAFKPSCIECGITQTLSVKRVPGGKGTIPYKYCVDLGNIVGAFTVSFQVPATLPSNFTISAYQDGGDSNSFSTNESGYFNLTKFNVENNIVYIEVNPNDNPVLNISVNVSCVQKTTLNIVQVFVANNSNAGETIHAEYKYQSGYYLSPTQSNLVTISSSPINPTASMYYQTAGFIGTGGFPPEGSVVTIQTNQIPPDDFSFPIGTTPFRYLSSNTIYPNTQEGIRDLLAAAAGNNVTPVMVSGQLRYADFYMPIPNYFLYLIWDFRKSYAVSLCYSNSSTSGACCGCPL